MSEVQSHYDNHLASIYDWMAGGFEAAKQRNITLFSQIKWLNKQQQQNLLQSNPQSNLQSNAITSTSNTNTDTNTDIHSTTLSNQEYSSSSTLTSPSPSSTSKPIAVDLGAGSGYQTIILAEYGYKVIAIDFSVDLLNTLNEKKENYEIDVIKDDINNFTNHLTSVVQLIICMGDTLTHLSTLDEVKKLIINSYQSLETNGHLILSFRDFYTRELSGTDRFIPVRSDSEHVFICFLEYFSDYVQVHDLLHTRIASTGETKFTSSSYRKLRINPQFIQETLVEVGFLIDEFVLVNGMITISAIKT